MYLVFTHMSGESYRRRFWSLLLCPLAVESDLCSLLVDSFWKHFSDTAGTFWETWFWVDNAKLTKLMLMARTKKERNKKKNKKKKKGKKVPYAYIQDFSILFSWKPAVGQNVARHVSLTARNFVFAVSAFLIQAYIAFQPKVTCNVICEFKFYLRSGDLCLPLIRNSPLTGHEISRAGIAYW